MEGRQRSEWLVVRHDIGTADLAHELEERSTFPSIEVVECNNKVSQFVYRQSNLIATEVECDKVPAKMGIYLFIGNNALEMFTSSGSLWLCAYPELTSCRSTEVQTRI